MAETAGFANSIFIWAGFAFLGAITAALVVAVVSHGPMLSGILSDRSGGPVGMHRGAFALGNIGLAILFLMRIVEFDGSEDAIEALKLIANLAGEDAQFPVQFPAMSGGLSGLYLWGKMQGKRQS